MASAGISGTGVAVATIGGLLVYAGLRGIGPIAALQAVATGKPTTPTSAGLDLGAGPGSGTSSTAGVGVFGKTTTGAAVVAAAGKYLNDLYSQPKRTQAGYSDCSSFVDKCMLDAGVAPPGDRWANSTSYRLASTFTTIPMSQTLPGDIAVSSHHIVLITGAGGTNAIGQQNHIVNVRSGTVASLMTGQSYVCRRNAKINPIIKSPGSTPTGIK
jgi:hypothetical protein